MTRETIKILLEFIWKMAMIFWVYSIGKRVNVHEKTWKMQFQLNKLQGDMFRDVDQILEGLQGGEKTE